MAYPRNSGDTATGLLIGAVVLIALIIGVMSFSSFQAQHTKVLTVCDKERAATDNGAEYRIYTDKGTFTMKDSILGKTRFNTADAYGKVKVNTTYEATYKGWRAGFLSWMPNILELKKLPKDQQTPHACD